MTIVDVSVGKNGWKKSWRDHFADVSKMVAIGGGAEQKIRKYLVDNNYIDTVIQLPLNAEIASMVVRQNELRAAIDEIVADLEGSPQ
jgi:hypothetical protein